MFTISKDASIKELKNRIESFQRFCSATQHEIKAGKLQVLALKRYIKALKQQLKKITKKGN